MKTSRRKQFKKLDQMAIGLSIVCVGIFIFVLANTSLSHLLTGSIIGGMPISSPSLSPKPAPSLLTPSVFPSTSPLIPPTGACYAQGKTCRNNVTQADCEHSFGVFAPGVCKPNAETSVGSGAVNIPWCTPDTIAAALVECKKDIIARAICSAGTEPIWIVTPVVINDPDVHPGVNDVGQCAITCLGTYTCAKIPDPNNHV